MAAYDPGYARLAWVGSVSSASPVWRLRDASTAEELVCVGVPATWCGGGSGSSEHAGGGASVARGEAAGGGLERRLDSKRRRPGEWEEPPAGRAGPGCPSWTWAAEPRGGRAGGSCNAGRVGRWDEWAGDGDDGRGGGLKGAAGEYYGLRQGSGGGRGEQAGKGGGAVELLPGWGSADFEGRGSCVKGLGGWGGVCNFGGDGGGREERDKSGQEGGGGGLYAAPGLVCGRTLPQPQPPRGEDRGAGPGWAEREVARLEMQVEELRRRSRAAVIAAVERLKGGGGPGRHAA